MSATQFEDLPRHKDESIVKTAQYPINCIRWGSCGLAVLCILGTIYLHFTIS